MEKLTSRPWQKIVEAQSWELIGTRIPGEGNGYHDQISPSFSEIASYKIEEPIISHELRNYLRGLQTFLALDVSFYRIPDITVNKAISITNFSKEYRKTITKYLGKGNFYGSQTVQRTILSTIAHWSNDLVDHGLSVYEIVLWKTNDDNLTYAFQLVRLYPQFINLNKGEVVYRYPDAIHTSNPQFKTVKIPKNKCIIIEWPTERGGTAGHKNIINKLQKTNHYSFEFPVKSYKKREFEQSLLAWGLTDLSNYTEFYKQYNNFVYKETLLLCTDQLVRGISQLMALLNQNFHEQGIIKFNHFDYNIQILRTAMNLWLKGEISFEGCTPFLKLSAND